MSNQDAGNAEQKDGNFLTTEDTNRRLRLGNHGRQGGRGRRQCQ
jgi:hypothetical protein